PQQVDAEKDEAGGGSADLDDERVRDARVRPSEQGGQGAHVRGRADGKELRDALHESENDGLKQRHGVGQYNTASTRRPSDRRRALCPTEANAVRPTAPRAPDLAGCRIEARARKTPGKRRRTILRPSPWRFASSARCYGRSVFRSAERSGAEG